MDPRRFFGVALVVLAAAAALGLDWLGRDHHPRSYTLDFARGVELTATAERQIDRISAAMARQPDYRATIVGHTVPRGDADANQALGHERARTVARALQNAGIGAERIQTFSVGGSEPAERREGEGERGYRARLSRAEVRLAL